MSQDTREERQISDPTDLFKDVVDREKERQQKKNLEQQRLEFDKKINALAEKTVDFTLAYGENDYRTQMMVTFLEVILQMKDVIDLLEGVQKALDSIQEAVSFIDGVMNLNVQMQESMLQTDYGFFAQIKRKRRMKKVVKNNRNRLKATVDQILAYVDMANDMTVALRGASIRMQKMMGKSSARFDKKGKKGSAPDGGENSAAKKLISEVMKKRGDEVPASDGGSASGGVTGGGSSAPSPAGGITDISDIV